MDADLEVMAGDLYQTVLSGAATSAEDPIWIDSTWLDTCVVVGLTCFILCLMGLSKVGVENWKPKVAYFCAYLPTTSY